MSNPSPKLENLDKGRGKKPKRGNEPFTVNLSPAHKENLCKIAMSLGCMHGGKGSISGLLSGIADETFMIVEAPPKWKCIPSDKDGQMNYQRKRLLRVRSRSKIG